MSTTCGEGLGPKTILAWFTTSTKVQVLGECLAVTPSQCSVNACMDYESVDHYDVRQQLGVWLTSESRRPPSGSMTPAGVGMPHTWELEER